MSTLVDSPMPGGRREARQHAEARTRLFKRAGVAGIAALTVAGVIVAFTAPGRTGEADRAQAQSGSEELLPEIAAEGSDSTVVVDTEEVVIPPESITKYDSYLPEGTSKIVSRGVDGSALVSYTVKLVDGVEVERVELTSVVLIEPTHDVVAVGTLDIPSRPAIAAGSNRDIGQQMAADYGWVGVEWQCLDNLFHRESGWNHLAKNPSSGAYGIPQSLPASKMATKGDDYLTNPRTQIAWGLSYVNGRYQTPCGAWAAFSNRSPHWY